MALRWRCDDAAGAVAAVPVVEFEHQDEAEQWLSAHWAELSDGGVAAVTLLDGDVVVYGPMSLAGP